MASAILAAVALGTGCATLPPAGARLPLCSREPAWPLWEAYRNAFIEPDGQVVDHYAHHVTSEGQAYGLFHALVARDERTFRSILAWTERVLAGGDLTRTLPAWRYGPVGPVGARAPTFGATPGILDANAASDADLWIAYALVQAAGVFEDEAFLAKGRGLLRLVAAREVAVVPGLGATLLPGPVGFAEGDSWRLNPSYMPLFLVRWASAFEADGPWREVLASSLALASDGVRNGLWPDWIMWRAGAWVADPVTHGVGSYDAIRAYLWPVFAAPEDPARAPLLTRGARFLAAARINGRAPEKVDTAMPGSAPGAADAPGLVGLAPGPVGFQAVAEAYARATGDSELAGRLGTAVDAARRWDGLYGDPAFYYDQNLILFARGFTEGRFRFGGDGALELPAKAKPCRRE